MRRIAAFGALFGVLTLLLAGAGAAQAQPRALIGFIPTAPAPKMPLLFDLSYHGKPAFTAVGQAFAASAP